MFLQGKRNDHAPHECTLDVRDHTAHRIRSGTSRFHPTDTSSAKMAFLGRHHRRIGMCTHTPRPCNLPRPPKGTGTSMLREYHQRCQQTAVECSMCFRANRGTYRHIGCRSRGTSLQYRPHSNPLMTVATVAFDIPLDKKRCPPRNSQSQNLRFLPRLHCRGKRASMATHREAFHNGCQSTRPRTDISHQHTAHVLHSHGQRTGP